MLVFFLVVESWLHVQGKHILRRLLPHCIEHSFRANSFLGVGRKVNNLKWVGCTQTVYLAAPC